MRKLLNLLFLTILCSSALASNVKPTPINLFNKLAKENLATWTSSEYYNSTTHQSTSTWSSMPYTPTPGGNGGSLTHTDDFGTSIQFSWSISGNTLNYSIHVVPGNDVNMGIHSLYAYDDTQGTFDELVNEGNETPGDDGYGHITWTASGSTDFEGSATSLFISFDIYTSLLSDSNARCQSIFGTYINKN